MSKKKTGDVLFVGSVPGEDTEEVLRLCAGAAGSHAFAFPDGEHGPRQMWIGALGELVFSKHPDIELLPEPVSYVQFGPYGLRDGVKELSLRELYPYADFALESYETFKQLRESGDVPADARFQVSLPTPYAATRPHFPDREQSLIVMAAWADAMRAGFDRMLSTIPAEDLVIQLDFCVEVSAICATETEPFDYTEEQALAKYTGAEYTTSMTKNLPEAVGLGYHICVGTFPQWPRVPQKDLTRVVTIANELIENTPHRVDYLHLPIMADADEAYFAPLRNLKPGPKVFLGLECR